ALDLVEDRAVHPERGPDAPPGSLGQQRDPGFGGRVVGTRPGDLVAHQLPYGRTGPSLAGRPDEVVAGDPEAGQVRAGQVHPVPVEVLADVADEVGQLEREAELAGRFPGGG